VQSPGQRRPTGDTRCTSVGRRNHGQREDEKKKNTQQINQQKNEQMETKQRRNADVHANGPSAEMRNSRPAIHRSHESRSEKQGAPEVCSLASAWAKLL
jgi:hypothetical protein